MAKLNSPSSSESDIESKFYEYYGDEINDEEKAFLDKLKTLNSQEYYRLLNQWIVQHNIDDYFNNGNGDANNLIYQIGSSGMQTGPSVIDALNNSVARENTEAANIQAEHMRNTSLTSAADQLKQLGLNTGSVIQTGGAGIGNVSTAQTSQNNPALVSKMNEFNQKAAMSRQILASVSQLASAGIYGGAFGAARVAAAKVSASLAHSAESTIKSFHNANGEQTGYVITDRRWGS